MKRSRKRKDTSWSKVAEWYDETVEQKGSYQQELILPNLLRLMGIKKGEKVLDLACGQGLFARAFQSAGANVIAADISPELIAIARTKSAPQILTGQATEKSQDIAYHVAPAHALPFLKDGSTDKIAIVLALQNIEKLNETIAECARVLNKNGRLYLVLNHPAFRIPKGSSWGYSAESASGGSGGDESKKWVQYRRIDRYLSNTKTEIEMHPGQKGGEKTLSFHRPLQTYAKALYKNSLALRRMEEWSSNKKSQKGPRAEAEDRARKEIPLFMTIEAEKFAS